LVERAKQATERAWKESRELEEERAVAELVAGKPELAVRQDPHPDRRPQTIIVRGADFTGLDPTVKKEVQVYGTDEEVKRMQIKADSEFNQRSIAAAAGGVAQMGAARSANRAAGSPLPDMRPQQWGASTTKVAPSPSPAGPVPALPTDVSSFKEAFYASEGKLLNQVASDIQTKLRQAGVKNPRLAVAVSAGVVDGEVRYVVTVSDPKALAVLRQYEKYLPEGLSVAVSEPKFVGGKLDPSSHVEIAGPKELLDQGAKGVVTGTNIPTCKGTCEPLWAGESGTPPGSVWHTNRRKP
jgi:hypothetical protein